MFLLDTNTCIFFLNGSSEPVKENMKNHGPEQIILCSVVKAELLFGAYKSAKADQNIRRLQTFFQPFRSFYFDDVAAEAYGRIRSVLDKQGKPIGPNDLMIASIAASRRLTLVTNNVREFNRIENLEIDDWTLRVE